MKYVLSAVLVLALGVLVDACPPPTASAPVVVMAPRAAAPMVCPEVPPTASTIMMVPSVANTPTFASAPTFVYPAAAPARAVYPAPLARPFAPRIRAGVSVGW